MKNTLYFIGGLIALILIGWLLQADDYVNFAFWAPKYENVRRNTFENTQSYVQGKIQDLSNYKYQYDTTKDAGNRSAIKALIRTQFANFKLEQCPDELKPFLQQTRGY